MNKSMQNCQLALKKLEAFIAFSEQHPPNELHRAAVIQAFEFTFEVFWKLFQKRAAEQGVVANSPKSAFSAAFQLGWIQNESTWLAILNDRNLTTHAYHEGLAQDIFTRIKNTYLAAFQQAFERL